MLTLVAAAAATAAVAIAALARNARALRLVDMPGGRKAHEAPTPAVGGLGILVALIGTGALAGAPPALAVACVLMVAVGTFDDRYNLPIALRLAAQFATAVLIVHAAQPERFLLMEEGLGLPPAAANALLLILIVAFINGVNWLDGVDGLLGVLTALSLVFVMALLDPVPSRSSIVLASAALGACLGFLAFNLRVPGRSRAAVFLGDSGSGLVGVLLAFLALRASSDCERDAGLLVLGVGGVFLADLGAVVLLRSARRIPPWAADRLHLHHRLERRGLQVTEIVALVAAGHATLLTATMVWARPSAIGATTSEWAFLVASMIVGLAASVGPLFSSERVVGGTQGPAARGGPIPSASPPIA